MYVLGDIVETNSLKYRGKIALVDGNLSISYSELNSLSSTIANALSQKFGIQRGCRIAVVSRNSIYYAALLFAIWKIGAVAVPVNWRLKGEELKYIIINSEPSILFYEKEFESEIMHAVDTTEMYLTLVLINGTSSKGFTLNDLLRWGRNFSLSFTVEPNDIAMIMYTSGTTGRPKGVVFTHAREIADLCDHLIELDMLDTDVVLLNMPWFHNGGLTLGLMHTLMRGATGVIYSGSFMAESVLQVIEKNRVSVLNVVPTMLARLVAVENLCGFDISTVQKIYYGGAPIPQRVQERAMQVFPKARFYQTYGQTESGMLLVLKPEDHLTERRAFTGKPLCLATVKAVIGERDATVGEVGELICKQKPLAMSGYWRNEEATKEVLINGWLHTTDLARVEEDGYFTIVGRLKDMIITGGENVYAKEVENVISEHPHVEDVAVFGLPDDEWGEIVCAAIVPKEGSSISSEDVIQYCKSRLAGYKTPRKIIFLKELPKNAAGKVLKSVLQEMAKTF